ncbi:biopolymer transporter ExbD [Armatimonas sp.]|uniref:ExbD/TolR family protein n=1 Tax=Armatimonas sp. TaxID=1872638 RepID=UPI00286A354A|nr:biopolymer transporter ExbD [Armatimonas sp.]
MRFSGQREAKHTKIEIIPMIDTMFFLLVFFVLASLNIIDLRGLNLDLPPAAPNSPSVKKAEDVKLEIEIDKDGNKTLNGGAKQVPIKLAKGISCSADLYKLIDGQLGRPARPSDLEKVTVVISPDPETAHENVINAVDDARSAKIEKFSIR